MAKAFSVASWNVKNLKGDKDRIKRIVRDFQVSGRMNYIKLINA